VSPSMRRWPAPLDHHEFAVTTGEFVDGLARPDGQDRVVGAVKHEEWSAGQLVSIFATG
jgi:hypothetical protein